MCPWTLDSAPVSIPVFNIPRYICLAVCDRKWERKKTGIIGGEEWSLMKIARFKNTKPTCKSL